MVKYLKELQKLINKLKAINLKGEKVDEGRLTKIFRYEGTKKVPIEVGEAGDIVVIAGLEKANVADTICDLEVNEPIPCNSYRSTNNVHYNNCKQFSFSRHRR